MDAPHFMNTQFLRSLNIQKLAEIEELVYINGGSI